MIQHREHEGFELSFVTLLSPILHLLVVPCHVRLSFPQGLVCEAKLPLASTRSLSKRVSRNGVSILANETDRYCSYFSRSAVVFTIL